MAAIHEDLKVGTETKHEAKMDGLEETKDATNEANFKSNITSTTGKDTKQDTAGSKVKLYSGIYEEIVLVPVFRMTSSYP